ncbi:MAG TPA: amidohydrolase family protein [Chloroflexota bacterium]|nr:amidohydrolase family protein [Chloroflexota bacterium]
MPRPFPVIDADGHVVEVDREVREYLPPPYQGREWKRDYYLYPRGDGWAKGHRWAHQREQPDAALWLRFLDACEITVTVLYPTAGLHAGFIRDPDWAVALAQGYNNWLYDRFLRVSPRLQGVALLPVQDPPEAAKELERAVRELGMVGGVLPAVLSPMRGYGSREFDPIYATAERLDVPLAVHGGPTGQLGLDHFPTFAEAWPLGHPFAQMQQLTSMVIHGVFERYPRLRVAYLEAGCGWVPFLLDRLDASWERLADRFPAPLPRRPREYLCGGNVYYAAEIEESTLSTVARLVGGTQLLWASDFPHERAWEAFLGDLDTLLAREDLAESTKRQILLENPCRLYRLPIPAAAASSGQAPAERPAAP